MKEHMKYIIDHAEEIEKLIKVKAQVSEVKSIMLENIDKVLSSFLIFSHCLTCNPLAFLFFLDISMMSTGKWGRFCSRRVAIVCRLVTIILFLCPSH